MGAFLACDAICTALGQTTRKFVFSTDAIECRIQSMQLDNILLDVKNSRVYVVFNIEANDSFHTRIRIRTSILNRTIKIRVEYCLQDFCCL